MIFIKFVIFLGFVLFLFLSQFCVNYLEIIWIGWEDFAVILMLTYLFL